MQVTALTAAYTGSQRQNNDLLFGQSQTGKKQNFEEFLFPSPDAPAGAAMPPTPEAVETAMQRTVERITTLLGEEIAKDVVNEDGSVNLVRLAQVMNAADRPYANSAQTTFANAPQLVSLLA